MSTKVDRYGMDAYIPDKSGQDQSSWVVIGHHGGGHGVNGDRGGGGGQHHILLDACVV